MFTLWFMHLIGITQEEGGYLKLNSLTFDIYYSLHYPYTQGSVYWHNS